MPTPTSRLAAALGATALLAAVAVVPALAQDAKPAPDSCSNLFTDKAGDAVYSPGGQPTPATQPGQGNVDTTGGFLKYATVDGKPKVTANILIADLNKTISPGATAHWYQFFFTVDKQALVAHAVLDVSGEVGYYIGRNAEITDDNPQGTKVADSTGALHEGKDGVIEVELPMDALKLAGKTISGTGVEIRVSTGRTHQTPPTKAVYYAPIADDAAGKGSFVAAPCAKAGATVVAGAAGALTGATGGGGAGASPGAATLELKVTVPKLKASKLKKGKSFKVALESTGKVTGLTGQLRSGSKVLATGKLAELAGKAPIKLKTKKKVKKGNYSLVFKGTGPDGKAASAAVAVKVK